MAMAANDILLAATPEAQDPAAEVRERTEQIRAILSGQEVDVPLVLTAGVPVVLDGADPDADLAYAAERADYDPGER
jgi:metal-dependent HD superfamily phosphatase/phosphodiesterase